VRCPSSKRQESRSRDQRVTEYGGVHAALFCDLYELTMAAAYHASGVEGTATFELFVRSLPDDRNFLVSAGTAEVLAAVERWAFDDDAIAYVRSLGQFSESFIDRLAGTRFTGSMRSIAEGDVAFQSEPLLEVTAPLLEAQLLETLLLNIVGTATMQASKAARVAIACGDRHFADFSARRDHGVAAAMSAARSAAIAGASSTSLVEAGRRYGLGLSGTMAHAFVMAFDDERDAFRCFAKAFPHNTVLLLDTWDTVRGAHHAVEIAHELEGDGVQLAAVRLDSGDLGALAHEVRRVLDDGGLRDVQILASGDLDEYRIADLVTSGAPIDSFGVGTKLGTSADAPTLGVIYKLVEDERGPKMKLAEEKATLPGRKQVWRCDGHDVIGLMDEEYHGRPLLAPARSESLDVIRERCRAAVDELPERYRSLERVRPRYEVRHSPRLDELVSTITAEHRS
jgi:nicotinate phosphoribosyltransferase